MTKRASSSASDAEALPSSSKAAATEAEVTKSLEKDNTKRRKVNEDAVPVLVSTDYVRSSYSGVGYNNDPQTSPLLIMLPPHVLSHCLSFVPTSKDRMSIVTTCKDFREACDSQSVLELLDLGGMPCTGYCGFIVDEDTRDTALKRLTKLVEMRNRQACHMVGIIKAYCYNDVSAGVRFLSIASKLGYVQSTYVLGLILRDTHPKISERLLEEASRQGFLPAQQEILKPEDVKRLHGEPDAAELASYLDSFGLARLLKRTYTQYPPDSKASHCWNPHCGRFYKSSGSSGNGNRRGAEDVDDRETTCGGSLRDFLSRLGSSVGVTPCSSEGGSVVLPRLSRMKMCSECRRAKYCSKLCQVYAWRSGRHKSECRRGEAFDPN